MRWWKVLLVCWALALCLGCREGDPELYLPTSEQEARTIYLVGHGWHAGIVIRRADVPVAHWPEQQAFPEATYLEAGWGDAAYYQAPDPSVGKILKGGLWPTPSVLHVVGFRRPVTDYFPNSKIIRIDLSQQGLEALARYIHVSYARDEGGNVIPTGPGLYGNSTFYEAQGRYHAFNNCNHWTARALRAAGCPITPVYAITVENLLDQASAFGKIIQQPEQATE